MINFISYRNTATEIVIPEHVRLTNTNFSGKFQNMTKLTRVALPSRITNLFAAFYNCSNLLRQPECGEHVVDMSSAFYNCANLNGPITIGPNVVRANNAFYQCPNIAGHCYIYSDKLNTAYQLFGGVDSKQIILWCNYQSSVTANAITDFFGRRCQGGSCVITPPKTDRKTGMLIGPTNIYAVLRRNIIWNGEQRTVSTNVATEREINGD